MSTRPSLPPALVFALVLVSGPACAAEATDGGQRLALRLSGSLSAAPAARAPAPPLRSEAPEPALRLRLSDAMWQAPAAGAAGQPTPYAIGLAHPDSARTRQAESLLVVLRVAVFAVLGAILALLAYATLVRLRRQALERSERRFRERWQPILYRRIAGDEVELPELSPAERMPLLMLTLEVLGMVRDEAADAVVAVARERGLPAFVMTLLSGRSGWKREMGIRAVAAMRLAEAAGRLEQLVSNPRRRTALSAAAALMQIDAQRGFAAFRPLLWEVDWSPGRIAALLGSAGATTGNVASAILESAPRQSIRKAVRLIELLGDRSVLPLLRARLSISEDEETTAAVLHALRAFGDANDRAAVVARLNDPGWLVRMQAAYALGGLGFADDAERLKPLLHDPNWWVRYRAAQSLLQLAGAEQVRRALEREPAEFARDMLRRVLAEQR